MIKEVRVFILSADKLKAITKVASLHCYFTQHSLATLAGIKPFQIITESLCLSDLLTIYHPK
jgi:hypothetical protein